MSLCDMGRGLLFSVDRDALLMISDGIVFFSHKKGLFTEVRFAAPLGNLRSSENDEGQINANPVINDTLAQAMPVSHKAQSHQEQWFTRSHGAWVLCSGRGVRRRRP